MLLVFLNYAGHISMPMISSPIQGLGAFERAISGLRMERGCNYITEIDSLYWYVFWVPLQILVTTVMHIKVVVFGGHLPSFIT